MLKRRWYELARETTGTCNECRAKDVLVSPCTPCNVWMYQDLGPLRAIPVMYCKKCYYQGSCVKCYTSQRAKDIYTSSDDLKAELLGIFPDYYEEEPGTLEGEELVPNPLYGYPRDWRGALVAGYLSCAPLIWQELCCFCRAAKGRKLWRKGAPRGCVCETKLRPCIKLL